jgi:NAD(P)-dependent dehydrogenase (short-subunit alcohol dehydrogenase family)
LTDRKLAVVTGAAGGLGRAVSLLLAEQNVRVVGLDIAATAEPPTDGIEFFPHGDITSPQVREELQKSLDCVDYLVNAAGVLKSAPVETVSEMDWDRIMNVNAKAMFFLTQALRPAMREGSSIVNVSSTAGKMASTPENLVYNASKAVVIALTKSLAHAFAPFGIRVNCVCPGLTNTTMLQEQFRSMAAIRGIPTEEYAANFLTRVPLRRPGEIEEIARVIGFLLSENSTYITGQSINICGGMVTY